MTLAHVGQFSEALHDDFYIDVEMIIDAVEHQSSFYIIHRATMFKVDIFISQQNPFHQSELKRARQHLIFQEPEIRAYFASPEDIIIAKLDWFRKGGVISVRQWLDVRGIIEITSTELDKEYLLKWANELGLSGLLEKAFSESNS